MIHLSMRRRAFRAIALLWVGLAACPALADDVYLESGSKLAGTIQRLHEGRLVIDTDFADALEIDATKIAGIDTDRELAVTLTGGDRITGVLRYEPGEGQRLTDTSLGDLEIEASEIAGLSELRGAGGAGGPGQPAPRAAEAESEAETETEEEIADLKEKHEEEVAELRERQEALRHPWTGEIALGLQGENGNNERLAFHGRAEARRETPLERLLFYLEGDYAKENGERTANEIIGGAKFERDIAERWFTYGKGEIEFDEFENLDLRTTISGGLGYFLIEEEDQELKAHAGLGYQHESFDSGVAEDEAIVDIGYDYRLDLNDRLRLTHSLTYFPTLGDPFTGYRLTGDAALEVPITEEERWKLRLGARSEYDAEPQPDIDRLDTSYFIDLVYAWE